MYTSWHINEHNYEPISLSTAARDYISFEGALTANYWDKPWYYALGNYPCFRLWPELANYLNDQHQDRLGVYKGWVENNLGFSSAKKLAALLEHHGDKFTKEDAQRVFLAAMKYEIEFFNSVMRTDM